MKKNEIKEKTSDKVYRYIEEKIIRGEWKRGDRIDSENFLAEALGVSRVSVREAIGKLVAMGILEKKKGGGSFVREISSQSFLDTLIPHLMLGEGDYVEILQLRSALDVLAVKLFIENSDLDLKKSLKSIHENMENSCDKPDEFYQFDMEFHKTIVQGAKNNLVKRVYDMILNIMDYHTKEQYLKLTLDKRVSEHRAILEAILNNDIEIAQIYMKRHLERSISDMKNS